MTTQPDRDETSLSSSAEEWSVRAADAVETAMDTVHDRLVRPAIIAGRGLVFGVVIATVGIVVLVLLTIGFVRLLDVYAFGGRVWASDLLIGVIAGGGGAALWSLRTRRPADR